MPCYQPLSAWQLNNGSIVFKAGGGSPARLLNLPCGRCIGCKLERSRQWAVRCMHEKQLHDSSVFITLTYDDVNLPNNGDLIYRHFQLFMKRLRKKRTSVRFFMCGEYGEDFGRPHFHALLFNCDFKDKQYLRTSDSGSVCSTSRELAALWPYGRHEIGEVTFESAAYVARYCTKKVTGDAAFDHYRRINNITGEVYSVTPEFAKMSLNPAIGKEWIMRYNQEVIVNENVIIKGMEQNVPKYYRKWIKENTGVEFVLDMDKQEKIFADSTKARLKVRQDVANARLKFKKRSII